MNLRAVRMSDRYQPLGRHVAVSERLECRTLLIEVESMDEATRQRLYNEDHALCLAWFEEHSGTTTTWPKPIRDDVVLVTQFKGIFKPKWMPYVLSVRSSPKGPYADSPVIYNNDRSWSFRYAREENKGRSGDSLFTNRALRACMDNRIPVGVLYKENERSPYRVLGLALPVRLATPPSTLNNTLQNTH